MIGRDTATHEYCNLDLISWAFDFTPCRRMFHEKVYALAIFTFVSSDRF